MCMFIMHRCFIDERNQVLRKRSVLDTVSNLGVQLLLQATSSCTLYSHTMCNPFSCCSISIGCEPIHHPPYGEDQDKGWISFQDFTSIQGSPRAKNDSNGHCIIEKWMRPFREVQFMDFELVDLTCW